MIVPAPAGLGPGEPLGPEGYRLDRARRQGDRRGGGRRRALLRRADAARAVRRRPAARRRRRRPPALRLARRDARRRAPLLRRRRRLPADRPPRGVQAQRASTCTCPTTRAGGSRSARGRGWPRSAAAARSAATPAGTTRRTSTARSSPTPPRATSPWCRRSTRPGTSRPRSRPTRSWPATAAASPTPAPRSASPRSTRTTSAPTASSTTCSASWRRSRRARTCTSAATRRTARRREDYRAFMARVQPLVAAHGKRVAGWEEIASVPLPDGAVVQYWNTRASAARPSPARPRRRGARLVMSPGDRAYLDMKYDADTPLGPGVGRPRRGARQLRLGPRDAGRRRGGGGDRRASRRRCGPRRCGPWRTSRRCCFPRLCAVAEVAWSPQHVRDWDGFRAASPRRRRAGTRPGSPTTAPRRSGLTRPPRYRLLTPARGTGRCRRRSGSRGACRRTRRVTRQRPSRGGRNETTARPPLTAGRRRASNSQPASGSKRSTTSVARPSTAGVTFRLSATLLPGATIAVRQPSASMRRARDRARDAAQRVAPVGAVLGAHRDEVAAGPHAPLELAARPCRAGCPCRRAGRARGRRRC